jgi:hypothetical protein
VVGGALGTLAPVLYVSFLRSLFRFSELNWQDTGRSLLAGWLSLLWFEARKALRSSRARAGAS